jgi:hypothetical protein
MARTAHHSAARRQQPADPPPHPRAANPANSRPWPRVPPRKLGDPRAYPFRPGRNGRWGWA